MHERGHFQMSSFEVKSLRVDYKFCIKIIQSVWHGVLMKRISNVFRFHKRGAYDVENEEKVKLGTATNH